MARKSNQIVEEEIVENIHSETLEEIMGDRFATYAKYVIQDRAIPDARDGLKPVQRRIIFAMYKAGNIFSRPTVKCAHTVGKVMGDYHPHGDSSIYEALVRMSQDWKNNNPLISFQGNNGSIDGDGPAAYRYTESRLSQIAEEMIRDIDKDTVDMALTFDDKDFEPVVLPSRFPNLLVNGTEGIAVGMATDIPTHNLKEVIDAIIYRINHQRVEPLDLMQFIKGPDFPGGGIIYSSNGLTEMYTQGRGRIEIAAKAEIVDTPKEKAIIVTEIPFKAIKIDLVHEIDMLRHNNVLPGIAEVRDESDRNGIRIVIEVKKEAKIDVIYKYLMTKSGLKASYSANMVAIVNGSPKTMNLLDFVDCYIDHQVDVITRRSTHDLNKSKSRLDIVNGLIKAISILDQVVDTIRASKDKQDAKINIQNKFGFNDAQSEAIVMLQLYKLSNTDITILENEKRDLEANIEFLNGILEDRSKLNRLLVSDLRKISNAYGYERKTQIIEKDGNQQIDVRDLIAKEEVMLAVTRDGYIKQSSIKSYKSSGDNPLPGMKDGDVCVYSGSAMTTDFLICFTNLGNFLYIPVYEIKSCKWKEEGSHINYLINLNPNEKIVRAYVIEKFRDDLFFVLISKRGQIKRLSLQDFSVVRYSKPLICMKLLSDDELADVAFTDGDSNLMIFTSDGNATFYNENELPAAGMRSGGVKGISKLGSAEIVNIIAYPSDKVDGKVCLITDKACIRIYDPEKTNLVNRLGKPSQVFKTFKSDEHKLVYAFKLDTSLEKNLLHFLTNMKAIQDIEVNDYHLTPMDYYCHESVNIGKKNRLEIAFIEGHDRILANTESHARVIPEEEKVKEEEVVGQVPSKKEEEDEPVNGYTQISIFDDDDEA
ncbi:MAG: DNA topoisomerase IV subunit A [Bacilli bacterium]|nr:DNA topoisomerase IV subunit A [Bacilli bacterium]